MIVCSRAPPSASLGAYAGQFHPLVDRRYPLTQIVEAYRYVETGQKIGNVVVTIVPGD